MIHYTTMGKMHQSENHKQKGFTLLDLLLVVAIIGVMASIAIPQYRDYTIRARWADNNTTIAPIKTALTECIQHSDGVIKDECDTFILIGATTPTTNANLASTSMTAATGTIVVTGTAAAGNCVITWTPNATSTSVAWTGVTSNGCTRAETGV